MVGNTVRVYGGSDGTIIGFSQGAAHAPNAPAFTGFVESRGYDVREVPRDELPDENISLVNVELRPAMTEDDLHELGRLCIEKGHIGDKEIPPIVPILYDGTEVIDNRVLPPRIPGTREPRIATTETVQPVVTIRFAE